MNSKPNWLKILEHYCFVEKKTGLTLPFVIGSSVFANEPEQNDISSYYMKSEIMNIKKLS